METAWANFLNHNASADRIPPFHQEQQQSSSFGHWNDIASLHSTNACDTTPHQRILPISISPEGGQETLSNSYTSDYHSGRSSQFNSSHPSNSLNSSSIALSTLGFENGQRRASVELFQVIRPPYPDYVCHDCKGEFGHHWRKDCPKHRGRIMHTSYQGNLRSIAWPGPSPLSDASCVTGVCGHAR
ncbi:unnamed protein product, partial [Mesorhabditis belari]|uniref:Uncharacterized protein n=1 Tax=Mesorhabditis belari TaxID=2138241 RepID=A0AAF3F2R6_9BILA